MQSLADCDIIWNEREIMRRDDYMAASLCLPTAQSGASYNAILVGSRKDWDKYLQKCLGKATSTPLSSVVIKEIIESIADLGSSNPGKGQAPLAIEGFTSLVLTLPTVVRPASSSIQEGIAIVPAILGFDPLILPKLVSGIFRRES